MSTVDMYVVSGFRRRFDVCQKCGAQLPLTIGTHTCECGQKWEIKECIGNPFARMNLERYGKTIFSGNAYLYGLLIKAIK